jgi:hypothetical protein
VTDTRAERTDGAALPRIPDAGQSTVPDVPFSLASPVLQGLVALAVYLAFWLAVKARPLVINPGRAQVEQGGMDPNFYVWALRWWPYAIAHGLNPLHTTLVGAPAGTSLAWVTSIPPLALLASPITAAAGPVVSYNLLMAVALPVSAWAAFVLCRRITGRFWAALAGGAVYGFSAYDTSHFVAGQLNLAVSLLLPLMAYLMVLRLEEKIGARMFTGLLALAMAIQFYLFVETFADMTVVLAIALVAGYVLVGRSGRPAMASLIRLTGLAYLLAIAAAAPDLWYMLGHVPPGFSRSPVATSLDLASLVRPRLGHAFGLPWLAHHGPKYWNWARGGYVGIPLLVLAAAQAALTWSSKVTRFLTITLVAVIVAAMGPQVLVDGHRVLRLPWQHLWFLPVVRSGFPARLMVFGYLALAVIMAIWLATPSRVRSVQWVLSVGGMRWLLALLAVAVIAANFPHLVLHGRPGLSAFVASGAYRHDLTPGSTIVVVSTRRGNAGLLFEAETGFYTRLAGGYVNRAITHSDLPPPVADLATGKLTTREIQQFRSFVRTAGVSAILVEAHSRRRWRVIFARLGLKHHAIQGGMLYRTS